MAIEPEQTTPALQESQPAAAALQEGAKHTKLWWVFGLGLLFIPAWLLILYLTSLAIYDLLVDTLVVALALGIVSYLLSRVLQVGTQQEALVTGCTWAFLLFLVEFLITLLNGTTGIIFSTWATYVVYVAIALAPWLAFLSDSHDALKEEANGPDSNE